MLVFLLHYTHSSTKYSQTLCPSTVCSPLPSFLNNTTHLAPHMDTSHNLVKQIRAFQWFHWAVDLKFSMWSSRAAEGDCWLWGYPWAQQLVSPYAFLITSCLTGSLQRLCKPDSQEHTGRLGMPKHTHRAFGCCRLQSGSVWGHAYRYTFSVWDESGLAGRVEAAISRQHRYTLFFLHRLIISPELCENISGSHASYAQQSHLWNAPAPAQTVLWGRYLKQLSYYGTDRLISLYLVLPSTACLFLSPTLWGKPCLRFTHFSEIFHRNYCLLQCENTTKLPILFT